MENRRDLSLAWLAKTTLDFSKKRVKLIRVYDFVK